MTDRPSVSEIVEGNVKEALSYDDAELFEQNLLDTLAEYGYDQNDALVAVADYRRELKEASLNRLTGLRD